MYDLEVNIESYINSFQIKYIDHAAIQTSFNYVLPAFGVREKA